MSWYRYSSPLLVLLNLKRTEFEHFHNRGIILCNMTSSTQSLSDFECTTVVNFDVENEDPNMSPRDRFRQDVFQVINDQLISYLQYRLEAYKEISYKFGFLCKLPSLSLSSKMIKQAAGNSTCSYPNYLEPTIESELIQFSSLIRSSAELQTSSEKTKSIELRMYEFLHTQNLTRTFPNIEIALQIYLSLMVSNLQW